MPYVVIFVFTFFFVGIIAYLVFILIAAFLANEINDITNFVFKWTGIVAFIAASINVITNI